MKILQIGPCPPPFGGWAIHIKYFSEFINKEGVKNSILDIGSNRKIKGRGYEDTQNSIDFIPSSRILL